MAQRVWLCVGRCAAPGQRFRREGLSLSDLKIFNPFRTGTETANAGSRASDPSAARMGVQVIGKSNRCTHVSYVIAATSHSRALGHLVLCSSKVELHLSLPPQEMPGAAGSRKGSKLRTPGRSHAPEPVFAITPTASKPSSDTRAMTLVSVEHHAASRQRGLSRIDAGGGVDRMGVETARSQALTLEDYLIPSYGERHGLWWPPEGGRRMDGARARVCPSGRTAVLKGLSLRPGPGVECPPSVCPVCTKVTL